ncbi:MAG TPA: hypothetical protein VMS76_20485 [Planctomycetota bacterium]|nr:hypothetical protein [Planctomycetota bacterium]
MDERKPMDARNPMDDGVPQALFSVEDLFARLAHGLEFPADGWEWLRTEAWRAMLVCLRKGLRGGTIDPLDIRPFLDDQAQKFAPLGRIPPELAERRRELEALLLEASINAQVDPRAEGTQVAEVAATRDAQHRELARARVEESREVLAQGLLDPTKANGLETTWQERVIALIVGRGRGWAVTRLAREVGKGRRATASCRASPMPASSRRSRRRSRGTRRSR